MTGSERMARAWAARVRRPGPRLWLIAPGVVLAVIATVPVSYSLFAGVTASAGSFSSAAGFPTYSASVSGAQLYHRGEDTPSSAVGSAAADSSGNARPGVYTGATDGPALWWPLNDGSGTAAADRSGGGNPGTLTNGPVWGAGGPSGSAVSLDGVNDAVVATDGAVSTDLSFTVSAWVYPTSTGADQTVLSQAGSNVAAFNLRRDASGFWKMAMRRSDSTGAIVDTATSAVTGTANGWTHVVGVYDDSADQIRLYVDGVLSGTAAHTVDWAAGGVFAAGRGWSSGGADEFLTGRVDDVRAYPRALTDTDVATLTGTPSLRWGFDAVTYTVADLSGNNITGTASGGPAFGAEGILLASASSQYITGAAPVHTDESFTVGGWVNLSDTTGLHTIASGYGTTASAFTLRSNGTAWEFVATNTDTAGPTTVTATAVTAAVAGTRVHVAGVYDDTDDEIRIYVNGVMESGRTKTVDWDATGGFAVGRNKSGGVFGDYFSGYVDEIRVWSHALTTTDLANLDARLTSHYEFENGSGSTISDLSLNAKPATATGSYSWPSNGHSGTALRLSGGYATTAEPVVDTANSYTVSAWARLTSVTAGNHAVLAQDGNSDSQFFLKHDNGAGANRWSFETKSVDSNDPANVSFAGGSSTAVAGRWTHVVGVYDDAADTIRLYVNGVLEASTSAPGDFAATGGLTIGAGKYNFTRGDLFPGDIDEVRTFRTALASADIADLYNLTASAYWQLDENTGTSLADSSGSNRPATAANTTWTTGYSGSALGFNGSTSVATASTAVRTDNSFTVAAWVYLGGTGTTRTAVSQDGASYSGFQLGYDSGLNKFVFRMRGGDSTTGVIAAPSTATATVNTWTHLTGVFDDTNDMIILYVDGVRQSRVAGYTTDWSATGSTVIGRARSAAAPAEYWSGRIDEVRLWKQALDGSALTDVMGLTTANIAPGDLHLPTLSVGRRGALQGSQQGQQNSTAVAFSGSAHAYGNTGFAGPNSFSLECWFRAGPTGGGAVMGFSSSRTAMTGDTADRVVYLDSGGRLTFGVAPGGTKTTIRSTGTYNDAQWHHVVASLGGGSMVLYVDGAQVASTTGVATAQAIATGYFRWGGTNLTGWANKPANDYFTGSIDEFAYYSTPLTANQIARHYAANH